MIWSNTGNLYTWWGWYADLGPYTGPWPPSPPVLENLPATIDEVDYVIGVLDPTDSTGFLGGQYLDIFRYWTGTPGSSPTHSSYSDHGAVADPANHLIVAGYDVVSGVMPTPAPDTLVPFLYSALGTGFAIGDPAAGHWVTVPLDGWDGSGNVSNSLDRRLHANFGSLADYPESTPAASAQDFLDAFKACADGTVASGGGNQFAHFAADTFNPGGPWLTEPDAENTTDAWGIIADPTPTLPTPTSFGDLADWVANGYVFAPYTGWVQGRDFDYPPGAALGDLFANYDDVAVTFTWDSDVTVTVTPSGNNQDGLAVAHADLDFDTRLIGGDPGLPAVGSHMVIPTTPDGSLIQTVTASIVGTGGANTPVDVSFTPPAGEGFAIHLRIHDVAGMVLPLSSYSGVASRYGWALSFAPFSAFFTEHAAGFRIWVPGPPVTGTSAGGYWGVAM